MTAILPASLVLLLASSATASGPEYLSALPDDDACLAGEGGADCALNALQRSGAVRESRLGDAGSADGAADVDLVAALRRSARLSSEADLEAAGAAVREAVRLNASLSQAGLAATFGGGVEGQMSLSRLAVGVLFGTEGLKIDQSLISEVCKGAKDNSTPPTFAYHIHQKWGAADGKTYATGAGCGADFTGGHWDPTAACGHASGNPACKAEHCAAEKLPYSCSPETFKWFQKDQYNPWIKHACELGDLSGMFGPLQAWEGSESGSVVVKGKGGLAQMTARAGVVDVEHKRRPCQPHGLGFVHATSQGGMGLDLIKGMSIVVHCGSTYEASGARLFCAQLL